MRSKHLKIIQKLISKDSQKIRQLFAAKKLISLQADTLI